MEKRTDIKFKILLFFGTTFYSGLIPGAPGTYSSLIACLFVPLLSKLPVYIFASIITVIFFISLIITAKLLPYYESDDPGELNLDELASQMACFLFIPISWITLLSGFLLFRFFDIVKPSPIRNFERKVKGPWGIMLDDVLAAIFTNVVLHVLIIVAKKLSINIF